MHEQQHDVDVRGHAGHIIGQVRTRMIEQVLPHTQRNMCLLLPNLTLGRYRDCRITEDYKIGGLGISWRAASSPITSSRTARAISSSLTLRLAFALATLPQELGTTPGFIFLDEPLSAFDGPRTEALVELLTHGPVRTNSCKSSFLVITGSSIKAPSGVI